MARPKDWYVNALKIGVIDDLEQNASLSESLGYFKSKFIGWCAIQRVTYENNIFDEVNEFKETFINKRLYNTDVKLWKKISKQILKRDNYICSYCNQVGGILEIDHIIPITKGGTNDFHNLTTSCRKCNRQKKDKTVQEFYKWRESV